jgi:hypothetical protein
MRRITYSSALRILIDICQDRMWHASGAAEEVR